MHADSQDRLTARLEAVVGRRHVLTAPAVTRPFRIGFRFGGGAAAAVVRPGSLMELWRVLEACVAANTIVIMQAANTGLTGGSTPCGDYDRPVVIVRTTRISAIHVLGRGEQVLCLAGATLHALEAALLPFGREPHSVIGSSCLGASVVGGVCNNSGGALLQRGPAFTELALFARIGGDGALELVNHLGLALGEDPETILDRLDRGAFAADDIPASDGRRASDGDYLRRVREIDAATPARFNADPGRLFEASGCAGRLAIFAVRLDTFPAETRSATFYIGANDPDALTELRRDVLGGFTHLPVSGEYIDRAAFDLAACYGKDVVLAIRRLGTRRLPALFSLKARIDRAAAHVGLRPGFSDRLMQRAGRLFGEHLPARMRAFRDRYEHHLILKMAGNGIEETRAYLACAFANENAGWFECSTDEAAAAFLHRFAVAGAAVRYRALRPEAVEDIIALDLALPRNRRDWAAAPPAEVGAQLSHRIVYGHFFCHVFHQDHIVRKGADVSALERRLLDWVEESGAEYPAEHNVGHKYRAAPALAEFYRSLDPCNALNPGIGRTSRARGWR